MSNIKEITLWSENLWYKNSKIQRLNVVRLRPEQHPSFIKGVYDTAFVFSRRNKEFDELVEGEYLFACPMKTNEINQENLDYIEKFIESHNGGNTVFSSMVVFFQEDKFGVFLIEQRK